MGYVKKRYYVDKPIKAFLFLIRNLNLTQRESQRFLDNKRVKTDGKVIGKNDTLEVGYIDILEFIANPKGLKPIFQNRDFAIYDKPSGILVHPSRLDSNYSLLDEIKSEFGKDANIVHRIDKETSGLILVSKSREVEIKLKKLFENREIKKEYQAVVNKNIENNFIINRKLALNSDKKSKEKITINSNGKESITLIKPIKKVSNSISLIKIIPITGRQHQIRVHLKSENISILGEPIYGIDYNLASEYLDKKLSEENRLRKTKAKRLMLNASYLEFNYCDIIYKIKSKIDLIKELNS